jgi:probable F420-dependent oxidoreductase
MLATGICLVIQRDPITLAKEVASLDQLSNGRVLFGIGAGWNRPEIANHGVKPTLRWRVLRERILAMKEIWTRDEAEYHGDFVNFDPLWSWPKTTQKPHPPVIMGGDGDYAERALLEYCDEWLPRPGRGDRPFEERINDINRRAAEQGRGPIPFTVSGASTDPKEIEGYQRIGAKRAILRVPPAPVAEAMPVIKRHAELVKQFS